MLEYYSSLTDMVAKWFLDISPFLNLFCVQIKNKW